MSKAENPAEIKKTLNMSGVKSAKKSDACAARALLPGGAGAKLKSSKKPGLNLVTDRVKTMGGTTPCSSPADGMLLHPKGPNWCINEQKAKEVMEKLATADLPGDTACA